MKTQLLLKQYDALLQGMNHEISILANTSAFLKEHLDDVSWAGFYLYDKACDNLFLGPFQGLLACSSIPMNRGVCGVCAYQQKTQCIENVHEFDGHIACDSASNSEIVVPIIIEGQLYGVLDLDSTSFSRFQMNDQIFLERLVERLQIQITSAKHK